MYIKGSHVIISPKILYFLKIDFVFKVSKQAEDIVLILNSY